MYLFIIYYQPFENSCNDPSQRDIDFNDLKATFKYSESNPNLETEDNGFDRLRPMRGEQPAYLCVRHEPAWQPAKSGQGRGDWNVSELRIKN